ncbi:MAG: hypothetical protein IPM34_00845 [Saprospiraceae bacterium]|nr:hypothetical protein [Saprospiraceae bacterium]
MAKQKKIPKADNKKEVVSRNEASKLKEIFKRSNHVEMLSKMRPDLTRDLEQVINHEEQIMKLLKSEKNNLMFLNDPVQFFKNAKIELSPAAKRKMEAFRFDEFSKAASFVLPNGQIIKPRIHIQIKNI